MSNIYNDLGVINNALWANITWLDPPSSVPTPKNGKLQDILLCLIWAFSTNGTVPV
jgi:hypothetical protein